MLGHLTLTGFMISAPMAMAAGSPQLTSIVPQGGQRGQEVVVECTGARLDKALGLDFHDAGIGVVKLEQADAAKVKFTLKIAPDCAIGLHRLHLRTANGESNIKLFSVGALPEITEIEPNSDRAKPQVIKPPVTINGLIPNEDVDWFSITATKGQTLAFEVEGMRLGNGLFDPRLAVYDPSGRELAVEDDTPVCTQDPAAVVTFPADGTYLIEVRETAYGGNPVSQYRLHVGALPRPVAATPSGGQIGTEVELRWIGDPTITTQKLKLPAGVDDAFGVLPTLNAAVAPSPVPFRLSRWPTTIEKEPNENDDQATPITVPGGVSGVISSGQDLDHFVFEAKKGQAFEAAIYARRNGSPLDSIFNVHKFKGPALIGNDDAAGPDSVLRFTCPEDSKYAIILRDLLYKSGPNFTYFLEVTPIEPKLTLSIPGGLVQGETWVAVAAGNRAAILLNTNRTDFGGPLVMSGGPLPAGVTLQSDTVNEAVSQATVVFEAAPDAKPAGAIVDLTAKHADPKVQVEGHLHHAYNLAVFGGGNQPVYTIDITRLGLAVTEKVPFKIDIVEPKVPIVRRGMMELPIKVERAPDFKGVISARLLWNPPGIGSGGVQIAADKSDGALHLDANDAAKVGKWKVVAVATSDLGGGPFEVSSQLATLEIAEPYLDFSIEKARTELGKPVQMTVKVAQKVAFDGTAQAELLGLPPKVATTQVAVTKDTPAYRYALQVPTSAPAGRYGGVFVRAVVTQNGQPIIHQSYGSELILDAPLPPKDPQEEARRIESKRKAEEIKAAKKAERLAKAQKRKAEREAQRKAATATQPVAGK